MAPSVRKLGVERSVTRFVNKTDGYELAFGNEVREFRVEKKAHHSCPLCRLKSSLVAPADSIHILLSVGPWVVDTGCYVQIGPCWDASGQPEPDYGVDQRIKWERSNRRFRRAAGSSYAWHTMCTGNHPHEIRSSAVNLPARPLLHASRGFLRGQMVIPGSRTWDMRLKCLFASR